MKKILLAFLFIIFMVDPGFGANAVNTFSSYQTGLRDPAIHAFSITPSDSAELAYVTRKIYVGGAGDITLVTMGGETVVFKAVPVGTVLEIRAKQVKSTGTTASMYLIGLY